MAQDRMVFYPTQELEFSPADIRLAFENVYIEVAPFEKIHGWYIPATGGSFQYPGGGKPVVLFFHGNGGNIAHRLPTIQYFDELGADLFLIDYRGYGSSDGRPTEENMYADAGAAYRWLVEQKGKRADQIVIFGRSLGGAVAIDLATRVECAGLIVESSFSSAVDMGKTMFPYFPVGLLMRYKFDSIGKISRVSCPVLVTHSREDEIVPFWMGEALYTEARGLKKLYEFAGNHNSRDYMQAAEYHKALEGLLFTRDFADWSGAEDSSGSW